MAEVSPVVPSTIGSITNNASEYISRFVKMGFSFDEAKTLYLKVLNGSPSESIKSFFAGWDNSKIEKLSPSQIKAMMKLVLSAKTKPELSTLKTIMYSLSKTIDQYNSNALGNFYSKIINADENVVDKFFSLISAKLSSKDQAKLLTKLGGMTMEGMIKAIIEGNKNPNNWELIITPLKTDK